MSSQTKITDFMHHSPHTIGQEQHLEVAEAMMDKFNIRHLPVQHGGELVGILSLSDVQHAMESSSETTIEDIMTLEPYIVEPETPLYQVAERMVELKLSSSIIAKDNKVLGIFTEIDALKALAHLLKKN